MDRKEHSILNSIGRLVVIMTAVIMVMMLWLALCAKNSTCHAAAWLEFSAKRPKNAEFTNISLKWKLHYKKAAYYKLWYRRGSLKKKMKVFSGKKTSYTLKGMKKDAVYRFSMKAYNKKGKVLDDYVTTYRTGVALPMFDFEYAEPVSHDAIPMQFVINGYPRGYKYQYIDVYRKAPDEDWKKVKRCEAKRPFEYYGFTDTDVTPFTTYKYRLRGYALVTIKGKQKLLKSPYSEVVSLQAIDQNGSFTWKLSDETPLADQMEELALDCIIGDYTSDITFDFDGNASKAKVFADKGNVPNWDDFYDWVGTEVSTLQPVEYNLNGAGWKDAKGKVVVKHGQSLGLRMKVADGSDPVDMTRNSVVSFQVGYQKYARRNFNIYMYKNNPKGTVAFLNAYYGYPDCGD